MSRFAHFHICQQSQRGAIHAIHSLDGTKQARVPVLVFLMAGLGGLFQHPFESSRWQLRDALGISNFNSFGGAPVTQRIQALV